MQPAAKFVTEAWAIFLLMSQLLDTMFLGMFLQNGLRLAGIF